MGEFFGEFEERGVGAWVGGEIEGGVGVGGGGGVVVLLGGGDGQEELVFPIAAHARGVERLYEFDDAGGVGACLTSAPTHTTIYDIFTFRHHVARQDEMIVLVLEIDLFEQMLQLLPAAVHIAHEYQSLPLARQMLHVQVANLYHVLEVVARIAAVRHQRRLVHEPELVLVCGVPRAEDSPPADQEDECACESDDGVPLHASRESINLVVYRLWY